jgi:hypothetical protein
MKRGAPTARAELDEGHEAVWRRYRANVARHLIGVARDLQARVLESLRDDHGYEGLRPSLGPFLSLVWLEGRSIGSPSDRATSNAFSIRASDAGSASCSRRSAGHSSRTGFGSFGRGIPTTPRSSDPRAIGASQNRPRHSSQDWASRRTPTSP